MIVVRVELHSANTGEVSELARMHITNDGNNPSVFKGDYDGLVLRKPVFKEVTRAARVIGHHRINKTVWHLIAKMLKTMGYCE